MASRFIQLKEVTDLFGDKNGSLLYFGPPPHRPGETIFILALGRERESQRERERQQTGLTTVAGRQSGVRRTPSAASGAGPSAAAGAAGGGTAAAAVVAVVVVVVVGWPGRRCPAVAEGTLPAG